MRVPLSWLREYVDLPPGEDGRAVADRLVRVGLEVETVERVGEVTGPLVTARVLELTDETASNGKTIRWCQVDVGEAQPRGIVCGALNFVVGDTVVVALPGAVLPGGFAISARKTYGRVSDGMICSARELGLGDDHTGILVLDTAVPPGADARDVLGLGDEVLDIAVTPDRGYCLSVRGVAREAATAYDVGFRDPAELGDWLGEDVGTRWPVVVADPAGCEVFVAQTVTGVDATAPTPSWLQRRLTLAGMRPISITVDVTNYVMLELGQPIHGYDAQRLSGAIVVRAAREGEQLTTLDGVTRTLVPEDLVIADDTGAIGIAGVMGGITSELSPGTTEIVVEAAHFDPVRVARAARRHKLPSEASRRFERGVDPALPPAAARRVARLLCDLAGGRVVAAQTIVDTTTPRRAVRMTVDRPSRVAGRDYPVDEVVRTLVTIGCEVSREDELLTVTPPSWRPDLTDPADLVEEVVRLHGYDAVPSVLPRLPAGRGLTPAQRRERAVGRALAGAGYVEVLSYPFIGPADLDALALPPGDPRRDTLRLSNPISDAQPALRTTLLPGLLAALVRNAGRGANDLALYEIGAVVLPGGDLPPAPRSSVEQRPSDAELAALDAALPDQPRYVAAVLAGNRERAGWWGPGRPAGWADAVEAARLVARAAGADLDVTAAEMPSWHPGRCAALLVGEDVVGFAGELHPRVVATLGLPARTVAMELDLDALPFPDQPVRAAAVSTYPVAVQDVALVVDADVPAAQVEAALRSGAGPLLESVRLFDVYTGDVVGPGRKSLAFTLRFRAPDRTLTADEVAQAREAAVAAAAKRSGAVLRS